MIRSLVIVILTCSVMSSSAQTLPVNTVIDKYYVILKLDTSDTWAWENKESSSTMLSADDLALTDSLLAICRGDNQLGLTQEKNRIRDETYYRQLVPCLNTDGDRMVYVNALCPDFMLWDLSPETTESWTKRIWHVYDGGNCFWNVFINLSTRTYRSLYVNGF